MATVKKLAASASTSQCTGARKGLTPVWVGLLVPETQVQGSAKAKLWPNGVFPFTKEGHKPSYIWSSQLPC